jgi:class 3 adenylate cyclase/tetratricopeptide (TPR) repeat protein
MACTARLQYEAPIGARKTVTVVFSDLVGSTALGEALDSEALREVLDRYFTEMRTCLERHGGTVEKYIGDAVMAVFGLPRAHEDDAIRALRAVAEMRRALAELNEDLEKRWGIRLTNRTGVNTGEVVTGDPASGQRLVTGDVVNTAARLEQAAPHGEILIGEATYGLAMESIDVEPGEPISAKGKAQVVPAFRLVSVATSTARAPLTDLGMVGRRSELRDLLGAFERARSERRCVLATVIGEAGVGKTRLVAELLRRIGDRANVGEGRCLSYGEGITYWPLSQAIRQLASIDDADTRDVALRKLAALSQGSVDAAGVVARVSSAIGLAQAPFSKEEVAWGFRKLVEHIAADQPLVVILDDIQWAEPTLVEAVTSMASRAADVPLLFICMGRPEFGDELSSWAEHVPGRISMSLEPLSPEEGGSLITALLGESGIPKETVTLILSAAEGNPLFLEQMVAKWQEDGTLISGGKGWQLSRGAHDLSVPPSIQALVAARLDGLPEPDRAVLERAAVVGQVFPRAAVEAMSSEELSRRVGAVLGTLERIRLVRPDDASGPEDPAFAFVHLIVRDAAYAGILKRHKADLHERFGEWLLGRASDRLAELEEIVGFHFEQSYLNLVDLGPPDERALALCARAAEHILASAHRAFAKSDMRAAASLFDRAIALLPEGDDRLPPALLDMGAALMRVGDFDRSRAVLRRAEELARVVEDARVAALARLAGDQVSLADDVTVSAEEVRSRAMEAMEVFLALGDQLGLSKAFHMVGQALWLESRVAQADAAFASAVSQAERAGDEREVRESLVWVVLAAVYGPMGVDAGLRRCDDVFDRAHGNRQIQAFAKQCEGVLHAMRGDFERARTSIRDGQGVLEDFGWVIEDAGIRQLAATVELLAGDLEAAERELRQGYEVLERVGEAGFLSTTAAMLASVLVRQGRLEEADRYISTSVDMASLSDTWSQVQWRTARAEVLARRGELPQALQLATEAVELANRSDELNGRGGTRVILAEVLREVGRVDEATQAARLALEDFERKGNLVSAAHVRQLLDELS